MPRNPGVPWPLVDRKTGYCMFDSYAIAAIALVLLSSSYLVVAILGVRNFRSKLKAPESDRNWVPVTLLKPLCGMEVDLVENLRSFCDQDYGTFQVIFGVRDSDDPVIEVVNGIIEEFPDHDISLVVNDRTIGSNLKVSNLANMYEAARYDVVVIADSDMRVGRDYLKVVALPFEKNEIGAATCLYSGSARGGLASKLGAMFINDWFFPSALIPTMFGDLKFCFGATMAVRRDALQKMGSFEALANVLADDYMLGNLIAKQGYRIALVPYIVENIVHEPGLKALFLHEVRWARTIRSVQPGGYAMSTVTETLPLAVLASILLYMSPSSPLLIASPVLCVLALRLVLHGSVAGTVNGERTFSPWLVPLRDLFSFVVRICSFFGSKVHWREQVMVVQSNSHLQNAR